MAGVLCLGIFWAVRVAPEIADNLFGVSSAAKFVVFGIFLAAVVLPTIAAAKGSKWWLAVAAAGLVTLVDFYIRFAGPKAMSSDRLAKNPHSTHCPTLTEKMCNVEYPRKERSIFVLPATPLTIQLLVQSFQACATPPNLHPKFPQNFRRSSSV